MAGLTKAQRAEKEAKLTEETTEEVVDAKEEAIKYRCDFNSYDEYNKYKGLKG